MVNMKRSFARVVCASVIAMIFTAVSIPASAGQKLLDASFESGTDGFTARQNETVARSNAQAYDGSYSIKVSNRGSAWNGAKVALDTKWKAGDTYAFSCAVYQETGADVDMQLSLQYNDGTEDKYVQVAAGSVPSDKWTVLANPAYQIPTVASSCYLYVETAESLCDFYVDAVTSEIPTQYAKGDVNHDEAVDKKDLREMLAFLQGQDAAIQIDTSDMNGDGKINVIDFTILKRHVLFPERYTTTTVTTTTTTTAATQAPTEWPELHPGDKWYNTADISWIPAGKKTVALSFDDGPNINGDTYGTRIQNALNKQGFHATFFYWGERIPGHENEIIAAEKAGHEVANHTWNHPDNMDKYDAAGVLSQYNKVKDKLNDILGVKRDYLLRLPYLKNSTTISSTLPLPFPNSGIDSGDWSGSSADAMVQKIQRAAQDGSLNGQVVLMHETYNSTATAVETLCPWLAQNGYVVCTVSEMFKYNGKDMYAGRVYNNCW